MKTGKILALLFLLSAFAQAEEQPQDWQIHELHFAENFQRTVVPFIKGGTAGFITGTKGTRLFTWYRLHPEAKAQILICHGYSEHSLKYRELAYNFYQQGYSVFFMDQRGHGQSDRVGSERHMVDVEKFTDYSDDYKIFYQQMPLNPKIPSILFAHSMGTVIALDFLEKNPDLIAAAILSSPMFHPQMRGLPVPAAILIARFFAWMDGPEKFSVRQGPNTTQNWLFKDAGTHSEMRFENYKAESLRSDLQLGGASNRWVLESLQIIPELLLPERMAQLKMPIFAAISGMDRLVYPEKIQEFCAKAPHCELHRYPESHHEIWNEVEAIRVPYLNDVFQFMQKNLQPKGQ